MILIAIFFVLLLAADYSLLSRKDISFTLPVSGFTLSFLAYLLSWTGLFRYFRDIINVMILLFSVWTGFVFWKSDDKKQRLKTIFNPGLIGYLILCALMLRVSRTLLCQWDEFSHWGTVVKDMFYAKKPGFYPDSVSSYKTYPPGASLWELYFVSYFREWQDWPVIFAYNLMLIQWMMPLFGCLKFRKKEQDQRIPAGKISLFTIIFVIIVYLIPYLYYSPFEGIPWRCIYIDRALAIGFAWMLYMHFAAPGKKDRFYYFSFALGAGFQCLLKGTGIFFVLMSLLMILPDVILTSGEEKRNLLIRYGTACIFPILVVVSWYNGLRIMNISRVWDVNAINFSSLVKLISGQEESWRYEVIRKFPAFLKRITFQYYHGSIILTSIAYPLFWAAGLAFVSILTGGRDQNINRRNLRIALCALAELVIYELGVLLVELYVLTPEEGIQLSSGQRYSMGYSLGMSCFIILYIVSHLFSGTNRGKRNLIYCCLFLLFLLNSVSVEKAVKVLIDPAGESAEAYYYTNFIRFVGIEDKITEYLRPENSCYILSDDDLYGHFVLRKQLIPVRTNRESIDPDSENQCEAFLKEILFNGYDHVFVNKVSDEFYASCKGLFADRTITELTLYRADYSDGFVLEPEITF